jgi:hypothetical protein
MRLDMASSVGEAGQRNNGFRLFDGSSQEIGGEETMVLIELDNIGM